MYSSSTTNLSIIVSFISCANRNFSVILPRQNIDFVISKLYLILFSVMHTNGSSPSNKSVRGLRNLSFTTAFFLAIRFTLQMKLNLSLWNGYCWTINFDLNLSLTSRQLWYKPILLRNFLLWSYKSIFVSSYILWALLRILPSLFLIYIFFWDLLIPKNITNNFKNFQILSFLTV